VVAGDDARVTARRIVEQVLAEHAERIDAARVSVHVRGAPDTVAWQTARRIVDEVLAAHELGQLPATDDTGDVSNGGSVIDLAAEDARVAARRIVAEVLAAERDRSEGSVTLEPLVDHVLEPLLRADPDPVDEPDPDPVVEPDPDPIDEAVPDEAEPDTETVALLPDPEPDTEAPVVANPAPTTLPVRRPEPQGPRISEASTATAKRIVADIVGEHQRREQERAERERVQAEQAEQERAERERLDRERLERERAEQEQADLERAELERSERERAERERLEQAWAEQLRAEQAFLDQDRERGDGATPSVSPRQKPRTGRWLITTMLGAIALALLFPLAVAALRELVSLS
jgi:flagellar biosynthesis GTPase FlhF